MGKGRAKAGFRVMLNYFEIKKGFSLLYETNRFDFAVRLFTNRSQKTSTWGKNISDTLGIALCATFSFLPHFDVLCDLLLNRRTETCNLFVKLLLSYLPICQPGLTNKAMYECSCQDDSRLITFPAHNGSGRSGLRMEAWVRIPLLTICFFFLSHYLSHKKERAYRGSV